MANEIRIARSARRRAAALEMRAEGHTAKHVAKSLGVTESMVRRYIRDARAAGTGSA